jgi:hypothetical protein
VAKYKFIYNPITKQLDLVNNDNSGGGSGTGSTTGIIIVDKVDTYSLLPAASGNTGNCYLVLNDQGTSWLPGSLGGTFYAKGVYYSNGSVWTLMSSVPYQATQPETDAGTVDNVFVTPLKLSNYSGFTKYVKYTDNPIFGTGGINNVPFFNSISGLTSDNSFYFNNSTKNLTVSGLTVSTDILLTNPTFNNSYLGNKMALNSFTGLISGGYLTINNGNSSLFNISGGTGHIVDYTNMAMPAIINVSWNDFVGVTPTYISSSDVSYILITSGGTVLQSSTFPTQLQRRQNIFLGRLNHANRTSISFANTIPDIVGDLGNNLYDFYDALGQFNITGNVISTNGANLTFIKSAGTMFTRAYNYSTIPVAPNVVSIPASSTPASFAYRTQTGGTASNVTLVDPTSYDVNGVVTTVPGAGGTTTIQRVFLFPSGNIRIQYGQQHYPSLANAIDNLSTDEFVLSPSLQGLSILIGYIVVQKNCTDLTSNRARIIKAARFDSGTDGGSISTTTLQGAYNNSVSPEIITDSTRGAFTLQVGSGLDSDRVLELLNTTGGTVSYITGQGDGLFNNITGTTLSLNGGTFLNSLNYLSIGGNSNGYVQSSIQNLSTGSTASSDFVATANNGNDTSNYINLGINNSGYNEASFNSTLANDGYLFVNGGNLVLGSITANRGIKFVAGGSLTGNTYGQLSSTGQWSFNDKDFTLGGAFTTSGAFTTTLTVTANTNVTLPTSGTLYSTLANSITSAQLASSLTNETGTGTVVFNTSPTFATSVIGSATMAVFNTGSAVINAFGGASTLSIGGTNTGSVIYSFGAVPTANAAVKAINIGTAGVSGSVTNINLGSAIAGSIGNLSLNSSTINLSRFTSNGFVRVSGGTGTVFIDTNTYLTSNDLNNYLNLTGGTLSGTLNSTSNISLTTSVTTGQTSYLSLSNNNLDSLSFRYVNDTISNIVANTWQLRIGGISARRFALTYYDTFEFLNTTGTTVSNSSVRIPLTTSSTNSTTGALVVSGGLGVAGALNLGTQLSEINGGTNQTSYSTGDILFASTGNTLSKRAIGTTGQVLTVSGGVPVWSTPSSITNLSTNAVITEAGASWNGNQNYTQTITLTGAALGDNVQVVVDDSVYGALLTAGSGYQLLAWVSAANTIRVWSRVTSFISVPAGARYYIRIIK